MYWINGRHRVSRETAAGQNPAYRDTVFFFIYFQYLFYYIQESQIRYCKSGNTQNHRILQDRHLARFQQESKAYPICRGYAENADIGYREVHDEKNNRLCRRTHLLHYACHRADTRRGVCHCQGLRLQQIHRGVVQRRIVEPATGCRRNCGLREFLSHSYAKRYNTRYRTAGDAMDRDDAYPQHS